VNARSTRAVVVINGGLASLASLGAWWLVTPPPASETSSATAVSGMAALVALVTATVLFVAIARWRERRHARWWASAAVVAASVMLATLRFYDSKRQAWGCEFDGSWVIVGSEPLPHVADYLALKPGADCKTMLWDHQGQVYQLWTRESIDRRHAWLHSMYACIPALAVCVVLAAGRAVSAWSAGEPRLSAAGARLRLFINYRRNDSEEIVGRLYDRLLNDFPAGQVFLDTHSIPAGTDFKVASLRAIGDADVLLSAIGPGWLDAVNDQGARRLDDPADLVRVEIEAALARGLAIVPLLHKTRMPKPASMPASLAGFASLNGLSLGDGPDFTTDFARLLAALDAIAGTPGAPVDDADSRR